jgi:hypothetical protein
MKKLIPILAILLIAGLGGYKFYKYKNPDPVQLETKSSNNSNGTNTTDGTSVALSGGNISGNNSGSNFSVQLDPVINGVYKGVIEVGASGFNAFVVNIDKDKNWELVSKEFGESLAWEGFANTSDIYSQLKKYIASIANKGVAGRNIQFVVSSGALKVKNIDLVMKSIEEKGFVVNRVTADQEGKFALKALLPKAYRNNSFTVDIGSGNTKINWYEGDRLKTIECPGAKYFAINKTDQEVYGEVFKAASQVPTSLRQNCFLIGGVPSKLAGEVKNGNGRFTVLKSPDEYSSGDDVKKKCGVNIYSAIFDATKAQNYIFDWDANFTIGYLLSLN